jgi:hypothetical protein
LIVSRKPPLQALLIASLAVAAISGAAVVLASGTTPGRVEDHGTSPSPAVPRNPKAEAAAANTPPAPAPTQRPWNARTAADVVANLPKDSNFASAMTALSSAADPDPRAVGQMLVLGTPIYVRALTAGDRNEYLVPVKVGTTTIAIMKIGLDADGFGQLEAARGWSTAPDFPATSQAAALARASTAGDPATSAEFVWSYMRGSADELQPFWRLTRASGSVFWLFEDGTLVSASGF